MSAQDIYWTSRIALILLWAGAARLAWRQGTRSGRPWCRPLAFLCAVLAVARAFRWNWDLLDQVRALLRQVGLYEDRGILKVALLVLLGFLAILVAWAWWRVARSEGRFVAIASGAALIVAGLVTLSTCSLDAVVPSIILEQPGRYLFEGSLVLVCLGAILAGHGRAVPESKGDSRA